MWSETKEGWDYWNHINNKWGDYQLENGIVVDLYSSTKTVSGASVGTDTLVGIENIIGSDFNDTFKGDLNVANRFKGGSGVDTVDYSSQTTDKIVANLTDGLIELYVSSDKKASDTVENIENVTGTAGNDTFIGDTQANSCDVS